MSPTVVRLDLIQTLALVCVVLFAGYGLRRHIWVLDRYNLPAPVVGGFLFALLSLALRQSGLVAFEFDTTLQTPLMIAFFTSIGYGASFGGLAALLGMLNSCASGVSVVNIDNGFGAAAVASAINHLP